jgi:hypothetical protein
MTLFLRLRSLFLVALNFLFLPSPLFAGMLRRVAVILFIMARPYMVSVLIRENELALIFRSTGLCMKFSI